jgi:hypothetical protein
MPLKDNPFLKKDRRDSATKRDFRASPKPASATGKYEPEQLTEKVSAASPPPPPPAGPPPPPPPPAAEESAAAPPPPPAADEPAPAVDAAAARKAKQEAALEQARAMKEKAAKVRAANERLEAKRALVAQKAKEGAAAKAKAAAPAAAPPPPPEEPPAPPAPPPPHAEETPAPNAPETPANPAPAIVAETAEEKAKKSEAQKEQMNAYAKPKKALSGGRGRRASQIKAQKAKEEAVKSDGSESPTNGGGADDAGAAGVSFEIEADDEEQNTAAEIITRFVRFSAAVKSGKLGKGGGAMMAIRALTGSSVKPKSGRKKGRRQSFAKKDIRKSAYEGDQAEAGYLHKQSSGLRKKWVPRFFVIKGHYLNYYVDAKMAEIKGCVDLNEVEAVTQPDKEKLEMRIVSGDGDLRLRSMEEKEFNRWMGSLGKYVTDPSSQAAAEEEDAAAAAGIKTSLQLKDFSFNAARVSTLSQSGDVVVCEGYLRRNLAMNQESPKWSEAYFMVSSHYMKVYFDMTCTELIGVADLDELCECTMFTQQNMLELIFDKTFGRSEQITVKDSAVLQAPDEDEALKWQQVFKPFIYKFNARKNLSEEDFAAIEKRSERLDLNANKPKVKFFVGKAMPEDAYENKPTLLEGYLEVNASPSKNFKWVANYFSVSGKYIKQYDDMRMHQLTGVLDITTIKTCVFFGGQGGTGAGAGDDFTYLEMALENGIVQFHAPTRELAEEWKTFLLAFEVGMDPEMVAELAKREKMKEQVMDFYRTHQPDKVEQLSKDLDSLVDFYLTRRRLLNANLREKYGVDIDDAEALWMETDDPTELERRKNLAAVIITRAIRTRIAFKKGGNKALALLGNEQAKKKKPQRRRSMATKKQFRKSVYSGNTSTALYTRELSNITDLNKPTTKHPRPIRPIFAPMIYHNQPR